TACKAQGEYCLLLFDRHSSHVNAAFLEFCVSHKIISYCLPPHTTHRLQPLDVSVFGPYKHQYQKELTQRFERHEYSISKVNFYEIIMIAGCASFTIANIQSGFQNTGLCPVGQSIVITKIQATQTNSTPP
ncbi:DDE-domain-containing protein, partial [Choiromyces venosus 120613-1]